MCSTSLRLQCNFCICCCYYHRSFGRSFVQCMLSISTFRNMKHNLLMARQLACLCTCTCTRIFHVPFCAVLVYLCCLLLFVFVHARILECMRGTDAFCRRHNSELSIPKTTIITALLNMHHARTQAHTHTKAHILHAYLYALHCTLSTPLYNNHNNLI